jgi:hypothetical protein
MRLLPRIAEPMSTLMPMRPNCTADWQPGPMDAASRLTCGVCSSAPAAPALPWCRPCRAGLSAAASTTLPCLMLQLVLLRDEPGLMRAPPTLVLCSGGCSPATLARLAVSGIGATSNCCWDCRCCCPLACCTEAGVTIPIGIACCCCCCCRRCCSSACCCVAPADGVGCAVVRLGLPACVNAVLALLPAAPVLTMSGVEAWWFGSCNSTHPAGALWNAWLGRPAGGNRLCDAGVGFACR